MQAVVVRLPEKAAVRKLPWTGRAWALPGGCFVSGSVSLPFTYKGVEDGRDYLVVEQELEPVSAGKYQTVQEGGGAYVPAEKHPEGKDVWRIPRTVADEDIASIRAELIAATKEKASAMILALMPIWKQINLNARATQLTAKLAKGGTWTAEEAAESEALEAKFAQTLAIRAASDAIETAIADMDFATLQSFDLKNDDGWPA